MLKPRPAEEGGKEEEGEEEEGGPEDVGPLGGQAVEPRAHDGPEHPPQGLGGTVEPRHQALLPLALAALIVPNVLGRADDARVTAARTDVSNLMQALKLYKLDNQRFPTAAQNLNALTLKPTTEPVPGNWKPYLDKLSNDPWGRPYLYMNPGIKGEVDVLSFGADGQAGGEGNNADIGSWQ